MSERYAVVHQTPGGTDLPIINLTASATIRMRLYELIIGSDATPADVAAEFVVIRTTGVGSGGTTLTETALDPDHGIAAGVAGIGGTFGTAPVDTANSELLMIGLNQRATFRWVASPGGELMPTSATDNGLMVNCVGMSSGTPNFNCTLHWTE